MTTPIQEQAYDPAAKDGQPAPAAKQEGKHLTFTLGKEEFGVDIIKIREIIGIMPVTPVPRMPKHFKGVVNLRDRVIPVLDLRLRFGMEEAAHTERTCIIVVETGDTEGKRRVVGVVVDSVSEVLNIKAGEVEVSPALGAGVDTAFILGMAKIEGGVKILLDIDQIIQH